MEIYVARQPIFDRKLSIFGYELLYRRSLNNFYEGNDPDQSTAELINNSFLSMELNTLTGGTRAFINFTEDTLYNEIPLLLPKESIVVEILESVKVTERIIEVCKKLKQLGYLLALDDFVFHERLLPLIEIADIVKIEFTSISFKKQRQIIKQYKHNTKFLAEKIETREEYHLALDMGFDYFQGYFFCKPVIIVGNKIGGLNNNLIKILIELNKEDPIFKNVSEIIKRDISLSYKLLKLANTQFYLSRNKITSVEQGIVRLGINEIKKLIYLLMLREVETIENEELIKTCLLRGKFLELLANEIDLKNKSLDFFMVGMFSSIDVLLNRKMESILDELPLNGDIREALMGNCDNYIRKSLNLLLNYEMSDWHNVDKAIIHFPIPHERLLELYIVTLRWVLELDY
ncbi:HDOD domain-containing protein [Alkalibaculum sp. M08DMB]|uniref:HDOD domain-containing protein n=1 Tax=Alkalibaculum sporogenes TaxID=2655001 RepID=A0A6A7K8D0_9FIRM|nr:HDOD domain-containing protein [Alkalibaculum sporogenes]MPW25738.1 HDOD domain-containing protein [Alkalibaculum sporogenes]